MADISSDDIRAELEKQIADLKKEVSKISKSVAANASDALEGAEDVYQDAKGKAQGAARQVRQQAHAVSDAIRENPGTAATVLSSAGLIGFFVGVLVGCTISSGSSRSGHFGRW